MPSEQCVWLHDQESLLPRANQLGQQDQEDAIGVRPCWPFYLTLENGQLVSQKGNFCHQFRLASAKICQGLQRQGGDEWFRPTSKTSGEGIQAAMLQPPELGKNTSHTRNFSIT